ncbi:unnamed protein product [Arabis nemorensis]|uniref:Uncharacterized protein n=1 Tax=Arabis nemorensis TaxID=586526 RepID=A0A565BZY9_9BRAS|nr:unnamed protein product [Arabis nemorensis]
MQDKRDQGHYGHFTDQAMAGGQNCLFQAPPMGMIQFRQEYNHDQNKKTSLQGFSLDRNKEEISNHDNFVVNGGGSGSSNVLWSGIILGGDSGGPTW